MSVIVGARGAQGFGKINPICEMKKKKEKEEKEKRPRTLHTLLSKGLIIGSEKFTLVTLLVPEFIAIPHLGVMRIDHDWFPGG